MAAVGGVPVGAAVGPLVGRVDTEHPHTSDYDPDEQEGAEEALAEVPPMLAVFPVIVIALVLAQLEAALDDIDGRLEETHHTKHYQPDRNEPVDVAVIQVHRT